jgi:RNA polymerase primary sigma factor
VGWAELQLGSGNFAGTEPEPTGWSLGVRSLGPPIEFDRLTDGPHAGIDPRESPADWALVQLLPNHRFEPTLVSTDSTRNFMARIRRHRRDTVQSPLETYLREINEMALLTAEEEKELAHRIAVGDKQARDRMVRANLRLVVNIARGYIGKGLALQDLIEEGNLGLLRAVQGFDPGVGTRFSTYASYWIKQSIKRALVNTAKPIRIPAYMVELLFKWRRMASDLQETLGRTPSVEEVAKALELPKKKLAIVKKAIKVYNLVPQTDQPECGWSLGEMLMDERIRTPDVVMVEADNLRQVLNRLDEMDKREATILRMRFGLNDAPPKTLKEIGESLGLTRERVRQIENEALGKLSASMQSD